MYVGDHGHGSGEDAGRHLDDVVVSCVLVLATRSVDAGPWKAGAVAGHVEERSSWVGSGSGLHVRSMGLFPYVTWPEGLEEF